MAAIQAHVGYGDHVGLVDLVNRNKENARHLLDLLPLLKIKPVDSHAVGHLQLLWSISAICFSYPQGDSPWQSVRRMSTM